MARKILTREQAQALGRKFYYTGVACPTCYHMGMWFTETGECSLCRIRQRKRAENKEYAKRRTTVRENIQCPCGGITSCVTSRILEDGSRRAFQVCVECKRIWKCRNGVVEGPSTIGEEPGKDGRRRNGGGKPKPTIPGARVILGRCMSGSD